MNWVKKWYLRRQIRFACKHLSEVADCLYMIRMYAPVTEETINEILDKSIYPIRGKMADITTEIDKE